MNIDIWSDRSRTIWLALVVLVYSTTCTAVSAESISAATFMPKNCQPVYPPDLRRTGVEGKVTIVAVVDEKGDVIEATVAKESEIEPWQFRYSAVVAVWQWKFRPAMRDGRPVKCRVLCPLEFSMQGKPAAN